jgi:hypothetical protein
MVVRGRQKKLYAISKAMYPELRAHIVRLLRNDTRCYFGVLNDHH